MGDQGDQPATVTPLQQQFEKFCANLTIDSKEDGQRPLYPLLGTQRYFVDEVFAGLEQGIHTFMVLKGRQQGISTICNALDLFWIHKYPGTNGTLITDDESNRDTFKITITQYAKSLPRKYQIPIAAHNRTHLVLENRSRLIYQIAGTKQSQSNAGLGVGKAVSYVHGTECSRWGNEEGLASLMASLAEKNPNRLYVFESTAKGHNLWETMCETAERSVSQKLIFIGWWRHDKYRFEADSQEYQVYWEQQRRLTQAEREWAAGVDKLYGYEIQPEQWAWYRFQFYEKFHEDESMLLQEHPFTAEQAFRMTGAQFFSNKVLTEIYLKARQQKYESFKLQFGDEFTSTRMFDTTAKHAELKVWERPKPGGVYVVYGDPAYGSSENADRFAAGVLRCYADQVVQVCEYCTDDILPTHFAWVLMYLCGAYTTTHLIFEINGPGNLVMEEMNNVRRQAFSKAEQFWSGREEERDALRQCVRCIRHYLWSKSDSVIRSTSTWQWKTNYEMKQMAMNMLRDLITRKILTVASVELVMELRKIVREEDGDIKGEGTSKDDRVIAISLGVVNWFTRVRVSLIQHGHTRAFVEEQQNQQSSVQAVTQLAVVKTLQSAGILPTPKKSRARV